MGGLWACVHPGDGCPYGTQASTCVQERQKTRHDWGRRRQHVLCHWRSHGAISLKETKHEWYP